LGAVLGSLAVGLGLPLLRSVVPGLCCTRHRCRTVGAAPSGLLVLLPFGQGVLPICVAVPGALGAGQSDSTGLNLRNGASAPDFSPPVRLALAALLSAYTAMRQGRFRVGIGTIWLPASRICPMR
jgi:hypothetical protein